MERAARRAGEVLTALAVGGMGANSRGVCGGLLLLGDEVEGFLDSEKRDAEFFYAKGIGFLKIRSFLVGFFHGRVSNNATLVSFADGSFPYGDFEVA